MSSWESFWLHRGMKMNDELYCLGVEKDVVIHLMNCVFDDFRLGTSDFANALDDLKECF